MWKAQKKKSANQGDGTEDGGSKAPMIKKGRMNKRGRKKGMRNEGMWKKIVQYGKKKARSGKRGR